MAELQRFDTVILAYVPRSSGSTADDITSFSDSQVQMLVQNTEGMGCGLIMIGGPDSFGAGGWSNTELEKAMPVDFQIRNAKVQSIGALAMVMHASEMAQGNHWQKVIAREALKAGEDLWPRFEDSHPGASAERRELAGKLQLAFQNLPEIHQAVIMLRELEGLSYEEIATTLGIKKGTVMSRLFHARKSMQETLQGMEEADTVAPEGSMGA